MEENFEQCINDDDDADWSRPVEVFGAVLDNTHKDASHKTKLHLQSGSASLVPKWDHPRTIVHIDMDCFYAQVEMIHNPALRDVPLGIQQKYLVVTCNYPARARGVTKLMGISEAKKKCPELVLVSGEDLTRYREMSYKISEFLMKYTPCVERLGFDENFLDVTEMVDQRIRDSSDQSNLLHTVKTCSCGCHRRLAVGSQIAADIRSALNIELGITCCAGIAHNKLLAKLVGSQHKPNQQTTVYPCHGLPLISGLTSARHIPGIGSATSKRLKALGVETVADLQRFSRKQLEEEFGVTMATTINKLAFGIDDGPVVTYSKPQMLSIEDSFRRCSSEKDAESRVSQLITNLLPRMQEDGRTPRTLRLTVRKANKENRYLHRESRQCNLPSAVAARITSGQLEAAQKHLVSMAMSLFDKMVDSRQPFHLTLINVAFAKLEDMANNNITAFFTSQSTSSPSAAAVSSRSQGRQERSDAGLCVSPVSPQEKLKNSGHRTKDNTVTDNPKRRCSGDLISFFTKKQKMSEVGNDSTEPADQSVENYKDWTEPQSSQFSPDARNITLPADVDPDVFVQLPMEIQQEILQAVPQDRSAENKRTGRSSVLQWNSGDSKQVAVPSMSEFIHGVPCSGPEEQRAPGENFFVQTKKAIFSPTKLKTTEPSLVQTATCQEGLLRPETTEQISDCSHADLGVKGTEYSEQKDCHSPEDMDIKSFSSRTGCLSQQNTQNCQTSHLGLESVDRKFQNSRQISVCSEACDSNSHQTGNERKSLIDSIHSPKMSVPKGVAPDVFSALPPEIQREVAAEMAIQKRGVISSPEHVGASLKKSQTKSPAKQANSILNYLKKT